MEVPNRATYLDYDQLKGLFTKPYLTNATPAVRSALVVQEAAREGLFLARFARNRDRFTFTNYHYSRKFAQFMLRNALTVTPAALPNFREFADHYTVAPMTLSVINDHYDIAETYNELPTHGWALPITASAFDKIHAYLIPAAQEALARSHVILREES